MFHLWYSEAGIDMRLSERERNVIKSAVAKNFGADAREYLYESHDSDSYLLP